MRKKYKENQQSRNMNSLKKKVYDYFKKEKSEIEKKMTRSLEVKIKTHITEEKSFVFKIKDVVS